MVLGMDVGLGAGHIALDRDPATLPKKGGGARPQFSAYVYCGQTAECIKMSLGVEGSLSPGDFVLDGAETLPNIRPMSIVAKRLEGSTRHLAWRWCLVQATLC